MVKKAIAKGTKKVANTVRGVGRTAMKGAKGVSKGAQKGVKGVFKLAHKAVLGSLAFLDNPYAKYAIIFLLAFYSGIAIPFLPQEVADVFNNRIVQALFLFSIAYIGIKDLGVATMLAIAFVVSLFLARKDDLLRGPRIAMEVRRGAEDDLIDYTGDALRKTGDAVLDAGELVRDNVKELTGELLDSAPTPDGYRLNEDCYPACGAQEL